MEQGTDAAPDKAGGFGVRVLPFTLDANPTSCGFHYPKERDAEQVEESVRLINLEQKQMLFQNPLEFTSPL